MATVTRFSPGNRLLWSLSSSDIELLAPHLMTVVLRVPQDPERPNKTIREIYFPDTGVVSVVALNPGGTQVEVGVRAGRQQPVLEELRLEWQARALGPTSETEVFRVSGIFGRRRTLMSFQHAAKLADVLVGARPRPLASATLAQSTRVRSYSGPASVQTAIIKHT